MRAGPTPFAGWTLCEALERVADRKSWTLWLREKEIWERVHGPVSEDEIDVSGKEHDSAERQALADKFARLTQELWSCLTNEKIAATGERAGDRITIRAHDWSDLTDVRWRASAVENPVTGEGVADIRVYPIAHAPDAPRHLDGLSLGEAFFKCVLEDPEVQSLAAEIINRENEHTSVFRDGGYPGLSVDYNWPLDVTASDLARCLVEPIIILGGPDRKPSREISEICELIVDRLQALRGLLATGAVVARGTHVTGNVLSVDPFQWKRKGLLLEVQNSDVSDGQKHPPVLRWTGLAVQPGPTRSSDASFHVKPTTDDQPPSVSTEPSKGASRMGIPRIEANAKDATQCREWMAELMRNAPKVRMTKAELWAKAKERWPKLSENAFLNAKAQAIEKTGAYEWAKGGAPKKSPNAQSTN